MEDGLSIWLELNRWGNELYLNGNKEKAIKLFEIAWKYHNAWIKEHWRIK